MWCAVEIVTWLSLVSRWGQMNDRPSAEPSSWRRSRSGHKVNLLSCRPAAHVSQCMSIASGKGEPECL